MSVSEKKDPGFVYVYNIQGKNEEDLELNAKRKILEDGLGELVEGNTQVRNGQLKEIVTNSSVEGYVFLYSKIGPTRKLSNGILEIDAKGKVNHKAVENALKERYKELGKPKFLVLIDEIILGKRNVSYSAGIAENEMIKTFSEFDFLDKQQLSRTLFKEFPKGLSDLADPKTEEKILSQISGTGAQILVIGQTEITDLGKILDSEVHSYQSVVRFKILDVNTARVIAAENSSGVSPHINPEIGVQGSVHKAIEKISTKIRDQISAKWKPGNLIRVSLEGIGYEEYTDKNIRGIIRSVPGVNSVNETSSGKKGIIVLDVEALYSGSVLYQKLKERQEEFGLEFFQKETKPSTIYLIFKKGK